MANGATILGTVAAACTTVASCLYRGLAIARNRQRDHDELVEFVAARSIAHQIIRRTPMSTAITKALLSSAVVAGPIFFALAIAQMLTRTGFDIARHPLSLLSLGEFGWVQRTNFIVTGLLVLVGAVGFRRAMTTGPGATWGPILVALFGAGTVVAGLFPPDAAFGFPPGTPEGVPAHISSHGLLHGVGFDVAFLSLIFATFVFARRYPARSQRGWRTYSIRTGIAIPVLIVAGMTLVRFMGIAFFLTALIAFGWLSTLGSLHRTQLRYG
jgi:hypothetical protein